MMRSRDPDGWVARRSFALVLAILGLGLQLACRWSERFRSQLTRELTIEIASADGVSHHYVFTPRTVASRAGAAREPTLSLCFDHAGLGVVTLLSPRAVGRVVQALLEGSAEYRGNAVLVLWFYGLTRFVLPIGRQAPLAEPLPDAYLKPNVDSKVAAQIVRAPPAKALDPEWHLAHRQHAKMAMTRGSAGEAIPMW